MKPVISKRIESRWPLASSLQRWRVTVGHVDTNKASINSSAPSGLFRGGFAMLTDNARQVLARASTVCLIAGLASFASMLPARAATLVRTTGYDFNSSGIATKVIVEPAGASDTKLCSVTENTVFDDYGRPTTVVTRNCNAVVATTTGAPNEAAAPTANTDPVFPQRSISVTYNSADPRFVQTSTDAAGDKTTAMAFDAGFGVLTSSTDPNGHVTSITYDVLGRKTSELLADANGTDFNGKTWTYEYCGAYGTPSRTCPTVNGAAGAFVVTVTPVHKTGTATPVANGPYVRIYYDTLGREMRTETQGYDGSGSSTLVYQDTYRNNVGDVVAKSIPYYSTISVDCSSTSTNTSKCLVYTYDKLHRVTKTTQYIGGNKASTTVSYAGLVVTVTDPLNHQTVETKNLVGLQDNVKDANNGVITHVYDPFGTRVRTTDPAGNVISAEFDLYGRKTKSYDPDMGVWSYTYDALGELKSQTDAKTQLTTITYDAKGRMTKRVEPGLTSNWIYGTCTNAKGKLCEANTDHGYKRVTQYDTNSRPYNSTTTFGTTSPVSFTAQVSYDTNWRVDTVTYPGSVQKIKNVYTSTLGYLKQVQDTRPATPVTLWTGNSFDASGRPTQFTYGNGVVTNEAYYDDGRVNTITAGASNGVLNLQHGYDLAGNLSSRTDSVPSTAIVTSYLYDALNRVQSETRTASGVSPAQTISWSYDAIGNMRSRTEGGVLNVYNYNTSGLGSYQPHAVASVSGTVNGLSKPIYQYDANGNMFNGANRSATWTSFNMVDTVTQGSTTLTYQYDSEHQRGKEVYNLSGTTQRTTYYINPAAGSGLFYEDESGVAGPVQKFYVSAGNVTVAMITNKAQTWSTQYWHKDHLGSNAVTTDGAGTVIERLAYEPFGKRRQANGATDASGTLKPTSTDRGFTEHEHMDEVGLINMNGRVYDPGLGRFMSADTIVPNASDSQEYNRYSYVTNRPLMVIDPTGHMSQQWSEVDDGGLQGASNSDIYGRNDQFFDQYRGGFIGGLGADMGDSGLFVTTLNYVSGPKLSPMGPTDQQTLTATFTTEQVQSLIGDYAPPQFDRSGDVRLADASSHLFSGGGYLMGYQNRADAIAEQVSTRGSFTGKGEADWIYQNNSSQSLSVMVDASKLSVSVTGEWVADKKGGLRATGRVNGDDYWVHGQVTVRARPNGTFGIYDQRYDYEMHLDFSLKGVARNFGTILGAPPAGMPNTQFWIRYQGDATITNPETLVRASR